MRFTKNKRMILDTLSAVDDPGTLPGWIGTPPHSSEKIRSILLELHGIKTDKSNVARTLRNMERQGLVIAEQRQQDVWFGQIAKGGYYGKRWLTCYWNAATYEHDKEIAERWEAGGDARMKEELDKLFSHFGY